MEVVSHINLVKRLFLRSVDVGRRLIRLGLLPGCFDVASEALTEGSRRRTPEHRAADERAYDNLVIVAKQVQLFMFTKCNVQAVTLQALHLSESKQYATLASVPIGAANSWSLNTVSGTNNGVKKTTKSYGASEEVFCVFGASSDSKQVGDVIVPINRLMAVTFLNAEKGRLRRDRRRLRGEAFTPPAPVDDASLVVGVHAAAHEQVGGRGHTDVGQRGAGDHDRSEHESDASVVGGGSGSNDDDSGSAPSASPATARRVLRLQAEPKALPSAARSDGCGAAGPAPTGSRPVRSTAHPGVSAEDGRAAEP